MMKKILSVIGCLVPFGANAAVSPENYANAYPNWANPGKGNVVGAETALATLTGISVSNAEAGVNILSGNGITLRGGEASTGLDVAQNFIVGAVADSSAGLGSIYAKAGATADAGINPDTFVILSDGDIQVGNRLEVKEGFNLGIQSNRTIDATFGAVTANGVLDIKNVDNLTVNGLLHSAVPDAATSLVALDVAANTIALGALQIDSGKVVLNATGALQVLGVLDQGTGARIGGDIANGAAAGNTTITAASATVAGDVQNNAGEMIFNLGTEDADGNFVADGSLTTVGSVENTGAATRMEINAKDVIVGGTMKNDVVSANMVLDVNSLQINGGNAANPSFVNSGNFYADVSGVTRFENGVKIDTMPTSNVFELKTGTLSFGQNVAADTLVNMFANNLGDATGKGGYKLTITDGDFSFGDNVRIVNGDKNADANMSVSAKNVQVANITNYGALTVGATDGSDTATGVYVTGDIAGMANSNTIITSQGNIVADGGVVNSGSSMLLNGVNVKLNSIANNQGAGDLNILSSTSENGKVEIVGNVATADGNVSIWGQNVTVGGIIASTGGTTTIKSSENSYGNVNLLVNGINIDDGIVSLNSLVSDMYLVQGMYVKGGALNIGYAANETNLIHSIDALGAIDIAGDVTAGNIAATGNGDMNIAATSGTFMLISQDSTINVGGDIIATASDSARTIGFDADTISVSGDVAAANKGKIIFGADSENVPMPADAGSNALQQVLDIAGGLSVTNGGQVDIYTSDATVGSVTLDKDSKLALYGNQIVADTGNIEIDGRVLFNGTDATAGLVIDNQTNIASIATSAENANIMLRGGMAVGKDADLTLKSADGVAVAGALDNKGALNIDAAGDVMLIGGDVTNSGTTTIKAGGTVIADAVESSGGTLTIEVASDENAVSLASLNVTGGEASIIANNLAVLGDVTIAGDIYQGDVAQQNGVLNLTLSGMTVEAGTLSASGKLNAAGNSVVYNVDGGAAINGGIDVADGASVDITAGSISTAAINNLGALKLATTKGAIVANGNIVTGGTLEITAQNGITAGDILANGGDVTLDSGTGYTKANKLDIQDVMLTLAGRGLTLGASLETSGVLYQNAKASNVNIKDINVVSDNYTIDTLNLNVAAIEQTSGDMRINTGDVTVGGDINATELHFVTKPDANYLDVKVAGSVSGNVGFIGLEHMTIGKDYTFNSNSSINAVILGRGETPYNYWATVSVADDLNLGEITNGANAKPLIEVGGKLITDLTLGRGVGANGVALTDGQMGVTLFDIVDQGSAIWLLHAEGGLDELANKIRNLNVNFCNADGSLCFNYLDSYNAYNGTDEDLPVYISVRDTNDDNQGDSLYIVFDPRFGGPVELFKIQPIVAMVPTHTDGEYVAAGALDNMLEGQLINRGFNKRTPIEAIPLAFKGSNLEGVANELYDRMEYYVLKGEESVFVPFSRLFQVRELEQVMGAMSLNEHTNFRSFEDRMFDEFIWNRNRNLKKAWVDVDFGMFVQDVDDGKRLDGNRFNISGGFDWQESETLILGLTGRVSHMSTDNSDMVDVAYLPNTSVIGQMSTDVADTNIGLGGYLMKILGDKTRLYGNAFMDLHLFDVDRQQTFVGDISGDGTAFALTTEWGLMHDLLNQYVVGNVYARLGYNFGASITEKARGADYMELESDGYAILTPGYSLTAQKRIYPSAWFQIRPYATIGIEYDVLGMSDHAQYKFAPAHRFTEFNIDIDPMWANIGGGFEFLSATGIQVGIDYRYQYNDAIQLHNIKVSGSYRF